MKLLIMFPVICVLLSGCVSTYWEQDTQLVPTEIGTTNVVTKVRVGQKAFFIKSDLSNLKIPYNGGYITMGSYSTTGDVALMDSISKCVVYSLAAYSSMGSLPAAEAILSAFKSGEVDRVLAKLAIGDPVTADDFPVAVSFSKGPAMPQAKIELIPSLPQTNAPIMLLSSP